MSTNQGIFNHDISAVSPEVFSLIFSDDRFTAPCTLNGPCDLPWCNSNDEGPFTLLSPMEEFILAEKATQTNPDLIFCWLNAGNPATET